MFTILKCFKHSAHKPAVVKIVMVDVFQVKEFTQNVSNKCQKLRYSHAIQPLREIT